VLCCVEELYELFGFWVGGEDFLCFFECGRGVCGVVGGCV